MSSDQSDITDQSFRRQQKPANVSGSSTNPEEKMHTLPSQVEKLQLIPCSLSSCKSLGELEQGRVRKRAVTLTLRAQGKNGVMPSMKEDKYKIEFDST